jgi:phosphate transport system permease protein
LFVHNSSFRSRTDARLEPLLLAAAGVTACIVLLVVVFLWGESWRMLAAGRWMQFFNSDGWHPVEQQFGLLPMVWATLAMSFGAMVVAVPLGLASAIFGRFYAPAWVRLSYRRAIGLMAGIPSVVYGFWGLTVLVPLITQWEPPGASLLAGILVLAIMILPTVALTSEAALLAVPQSSLHGAAALGLTRKATVLQVALPSAKGALMSGVLLAATRALGETMAVVMVAGNVVQTPTSLFDPVRVLTANVAMEMAYAVGDHRASLFASGLILVALIAVLAAAASRLGTPSHA